MTYKVAIRKNETGEVRIASYDLKWESHSLYGWTDGNFGCDCNRYLEWERAGGHDPNDDVPEDEHQDCGDTAYSVLYAEMPDGSRVEIDDTLASGKEKP